jgi:hypothetical protein
MRVFRIGAAFLLVGLTGCGEAESSRSASKAIAAHAALTHFGGRLVMVGGWNEDGILNQVLMSSDGVHWVAKTNQTVGERAFLSAALLNKRLVVAGGYRLDGKSNVLGDVLISDDAETWRSVRAPWEGREQYGMAQTAGGLILFGGVTYANPAPSCRFRAFADVWKTQDGKRWERLTGAAPWGERRGFAFATHQGRVYLMGGFDACDRLLGDVWSSANGRDWRLEDRDPEWSPRAGAAAISFAGYLWLLGGTVGPDNATTNEVWRSADGKAWNRMGKAPWPARAGASVVILKDKQLALYGGMDDTDKRRFHADGWGMDADGTWQDLQATIR